MIQNAGLSRNGMHVHGGRQEGKYSGRTDLASTHGCMRINDDDINAVKKNEYISHIQQSSRLLLNLIDDIIDTAGTLA